MSKLAVVEQRPAAMVALDAAQIDGDFGLELGVDRLAEIMAQQHIFGRDGRVGLELEHPVAVALPCACSRAVRARSMLSLSGSSEAEANCSAGADAVMISIPPTKLVTARRKRQSTRRLGAAPTCGRTEISTS